VIAISLPTGRWISMIEKTSSHQKPPSNVARQALAANTHANRANAGHAK
jgi:hypothetical protein